MAIFTTGDSHAMFGWPKYVQTNYNTGMLCYTFGNTPRGIIPEAVVNNIKENDHLIFSYGEVDCRRHILKHVTDNISYKQVIDNITTQYFKKIHELTHKKQYTIWVYNVVPPYSSQKAKVDLNWQRTADDETTKSYYCYFNSSLKNMCKTYSYNFFDVYDKYADSDGFLKFELSDKGVHIGNPIHIDEFCKLNNLV